MGDDDPVVLAEHLAKEPKRKTTSMELRSTNKQSSPASGKAASYRKQPEPSFADDWPPSQSPSEPRSPGGDSYVDSEVDDETRGPKPLPTLSKKKRPRDKTAGDKATASRHDEEKANSVLQEGLKEKKRRLPRNIDVCHTLLEKQTITIKQFQEQRREHKAKSAELKLKQKQNDKRIAQLEEDNEKLHTERLQLVGKDVFPVEPDDIVSAELQDIFSETMAFSKQWSWYEWSTARQPIPKEVVRRLQASDCIEQIASERCILAMQNQKIAPNIVLNAVLNHVVCESTFGRPFAHLLRDVTDVSNSQVEDSLDFVMEFAKGGAATSGAIKAEQKLKVGILRGIHFATGTAQQSPFSSGARMGQYYETYCNAITGNCLDRCAPLLRDVSREELSWREEGLSSIVKLAWRLSQRLAVQYPYVDVSSLKLLEEEHFMQGHPKFAAHRGMKLKDAEDDSGHDPQDIGIHGKKIDLVIEPLLQRYGDANGENYSTTKILYKAMVWVVPPTDSEAPSDTISVNRHKTASDKIWDELLSSAARADTAEHPSIAEETSAQTTLHEPWKDEMTGITNGEEIRGKNGKSPGSEADRGGERGEQLGKDSIAVKTSAETTLYEPCNNPSFEVLQHAGMQDKKRKASDREAGRGGVRQPGEGSTTGLGSAKEGTEEPPEKKLKTESA
ncbi:hypothetical protein PV11_01071 [Exophiala sideris]|uniref:Uncharacterized protein n=1 Tax=Exophiala sideris TaxID=1016849 RepID=A0A0D1XBT0_9EURO|nr:hypothetical protein PV11_01071 [Exophiala sideris]